MKLKEIRQNFGRPNVCVLWCKKSILETFSFQTCRNFKNIKMHLKTMIWVTICFFINNCFMLGLIPIIMHFISGGRYVSMGTCGSQYKNPGLRLWPVFQVTSEIAKQAYVSIVYSRSAWLQSEIALFYKQNSKYAVIMENKPTVMYSTTKDVNTR